VRVGRVGKKMVEKGSKKREKTIDGQISLPVVVTGLPVLKTRIEDGWMANVYMDGCVCHERYMLGTLVLG
jgi:hypothetical protein